MVTAEEEPLVLKQFLRFGETRAIVQLMSAGPAPNTCTFAEDRGPEVWTGAAGARGLSSIHHAADGFRPLLEPWSAP